MQTDQNDEATPEVASVDALEATEAVAENHSDAATTDSPEESADEQATSPLDRKLRSENQSLRKRLREIESALKAREEAELSETERAKKRVIELEEQIRTTSERARAAALRAEITAQAQKFGIVDVDAASRLVDRADLEYDDDADGWIGVDDALRTLTQERPWLVQTGAATPGSTANPTNPPRRRSTLTAEALSKMSEAEINALPWEDVKAALAEQ